MNEEAAERREPRPPSALEALIPVVMLVGLIFLGIVLYGGDLVAGPVQVALIFCAIVAGLIGVKNGQAMEDMGKAAVNAISMAIGAIFILLSLRLGDERLNFRRHRILLMLSGNHIGQIISRGANFDLRSTGLGLTLFRRRQALFKCSNLELQRNIPLILHILFVGDC